MAITALGFLGPCSASSPAASPDASVQAPVCPGSFDFFFLVSGSGSAEALVSPTTDQDAPAAAEGAEVAAAGAGVARSGSGGAAVGVQAGGSAAGAS